MPALTYPEAMFIGLLQGVTELFPVSSLGHSVLIPAIIGGSWARDLNVSSSESPYLAFIVGLHVATAAALICYFWRDLTRIVGGLLTSLRYRRIVTADERLAWMIILATIPVGIAGLALEHAFRVFFSKPVPTALFLCVNGLILLAAERRRSRDALESLLVAGERRPTATVELPPMAATAATAATTEAAQAAVTAPAVAADRRLARMSYPRALGIGAMQIAALLPGISRDGIVTVASMRAGLSREDAVRFSFLLSTPVILAAGVLKVPDLLGPLGAGIHGQVLAGSALSFAGAYLSVRFLTRYFSESRSLRPFGLYCLAAGLFSLVFVLAFR
jgi:undecaprenyl-diphosphatase